MADDPMRSDDVSFAVDAALAVAARHALHDEVLVVALATGSLEDDGDIERARSFVDRCTVCRDLHADIAAVGTALRADARGTMSAPRDFRLTVDDARRLGGPVPVGGFRVALRRAMQSFAPQLGASMAAIGVVGLLVGSVSLGGGTAAAPTSAGVEAPAATSAPAQLESVDSSGPKASGRSGAYVPLASDYGMPSAAPATIDSPQVDSNPVAWLLGGSLVLLIAGLVLLVIAFRRGCSGGARSRDS